MRRDADVVLDSYLRTSSAGGIQPITYFKRFKMEAELYNLPAVALPASYRLVPWSPELLDSHASPFAVGGPMPGKSVDAVVTPMYASPSGVTAIAFPFS